MIFEPGPQECWPDGIEVSETALSLRMGGSCHVSIPILNATDHDIYLPPRTSLGSLQLVSSITPLDVKLVPMPETSEPVSDTPVNEETKVEPTAAQPNEQFLPEVNPTHLRGSYIIDNTKL